jgi:hypothetical protein
MVRSDGWRLILVSSYRDSDWTLAVGTDPVHGCLGVIVVATRGAAGPGEALLSIRGSREAYLAWSVDPLSKGTDVLVIGARGARTVDVEPWPTADFTL